MNYQTFISNVRRFDFIKDDQTAESVVKSVLGTITSRLPEQQARTFTEKLPEPLNYETLRHSAPNISTNVSMPDYIHKLGQQFSLDDSKVRQVVSTVLRTCEEVVGKEKIGQISQNLPADWSDAFRNYEPPSQDYFGSDKKKSGR